jgi:formylglycine-generating enzyme required for sulfatase activity
VPAYFRRLSRISLTILVLLMAAFPLFADSEPSSNTPFEAGSVYLPLIVASVPVPPMDTAEEVFIPAGSFQMGCDINNIAENGCNIYEWQVNELPLHSVTLDAYFIDRYPVTNGRYQACVEAGICTLPLQTDSYSRADYYFNSLYVDFPVIHVTWFQAVAFCESTGRRLPTEAEWEKAARGSADTRKYPWGNSVPTCEVVNFSGECVGDTSRIGTNPAGVSPYNVMDMSGNVLQWVNDWYRGDYYSVSPPNNPAGPDDSWGRGLRGGAWTHDEFGIRAAYRTLAGPDSAGHERGFRCARTP